MDQLAGLFAQYGVDSFIETTRLLFVLLDKEGTLYAWNPSFASLKQAYPAKTLLKDFLSPSSGERFLELISISAQQRIRTKGELEFIGKERNDRFVCLLIPLPGQRVLLIGEPPTSPAELEAVTAELERTKRILTVKETELKAVIAQAEEVSHTDALTFLPNRRRIIKDLQNEIIFSDRYGAPLSISMLDIDYFKTINDTYGHTVGDDVLRSLGSELRNHIRYPDSIGRYGGEEFLIVLPHSTLKAAGEQAERLCGYVRSLLIKSGEQEIALTVSIGIAQYKIHNEDWEALLSRADAALYQAKNSGRDRWAVAEE
ncbi:MAG TPA: GGDEF domain-containing protein [Anaerolineales bacterium]|nr:GGDEF domain-containing protein [Anaerolineales bacterium]